MRRPPRGASRSAPASGAERRRRLFTLGARSCRAKVTAAGFGLYGGIAQYRRAAFAPFIIGMLVASTGSFTAGPAVPGVLLHRRIARDDPADAEILTPCRIGTCATISASCRGAACSRSSTRRSARTPSSCRWCGCNSAACPKPERKAFWFRNVTDARGRDVRRLRRARRARQLARDLWRGARRSSRTRFPTPGRARTAII